MTNAISIKNLEKTYDNGFQALKGIDLEVKEGDFFALLGPNGAGKSTTIGVICSLVKKTAGEVSVFGHSIDTELVHAKKLLGVVPQEFNFNQFEKVFDVVANQAGYYGLPRSVAEKNTEYYLKQLGLWDKKDTVTRALSGGMKRRLMIARALVHKPKLLILDEPSAGVDIELRRSMWEFLQEINKQGTTIILTTHYLEEAESLCENIAIINHGEIAENTSIKQLLTRLNTETFIMDTTSVLTEAPVLQDYETRLVDEHSFEVEVDRGQGVNHVFSMLSIEGIQVTSMRNKSNRLEELFVDLVRSNNQQQNTSS